MYFLSSRWITTVKVTLRLYKKMWYSIYEEYVCYHKYLFMKLDKFLGDFNNVPCHMDWFLPGGIPF